MRKIIASLLALCGGVYISSATVTVQGWWHLDTSQPIADSSGNNRAFGSAYSTAPATGGAFAALPVDNGAGGPLGTTAYTSVQCVQVGVGVGGKRQSAMWGIGYNPPAGGYGIEIWVMPQDNGIAGGSGGWIFSSGQGGGVALRINAPSGSPSYIDAYVLGPGTLIGDQVLIDTNKWMHLAIVDNAGVLTFYTNGIPCGASLASGATTPAGDVYIGTPSDNQAYYGYLDEARMFTFAAGAFSTNDFLLRHPGPNIITQPQSSVVWSGGAAPFSVVSSFDNSLTYQWRRGGANLPGQTTANLYFNQVTTGDTGSTFDCIVTGSSISKTTSVATLTVVANNPANVAAYRNAVNAEASLLAYFPADADLGVTLTNTKDGTRNGTLEGGATYDGRTNRTFGARTVAFNKDGDVQIPNNPAFEFGSGSGAGTVEAIVYLAGATVSDPAVFSENYDGTTGYYYLLGASANGSSLIFNNGVDPKYSWAVPGGLIGTMAHVAWVFTKASGNTYVTAFANGQNLGTLYATNGFAGSIGAPAWIGGIGTTMTDNRWAGTVDELAVYGAALSQNTIQLHYSAFYYGTNTAPPSIVSQPTSRTVLAGASPVLAVQAKGTLPLSYQWSANSVPITGATAATLPLSNVTATATYTLSIQNPYGTANLTPVVLTVAAPPSGYPAMVMGDHPTAFWRMSDSSGQPAVDSAGFNDGTYATSGVTYGVPAHQGEGGTAIQFDGSAGRAIAPLTPVLNPNAAFSIEFWALANQAFYVPLCSMDRPGRSGGYEFYLNGNYPGYEFHTAAGGGYNMITGDDTVPTTAQWFHVVGVYDGVSTIYCYVNGAPAASTTGNPGYSDDYISEGTSPFAPNTVSGFYIGSRADNVRFFNGVMSDIAFYNYALSPAQVSNHWTSAYVAAQVVTQPAGVTNIEYSTVTLAPVITGLPNTYQWYKNNVALTPFNNLDGTAHYTQGVNSKTLVIAEARPSDSGQYHVVVSNPLGGATSAKATVLITADTTPPVVTAVQALGTPNNGAGPTPFLVKVVFSERIDPTTGGTPGNYTISGGVGVNAVTVRGDLAATSLGTDWKVAFLQTSGLTPGQQYTLTVTGLKDQAETPNTIVSTPISFSAPPLRQGGLLWDYYYSVANGVGNLMAFQYYLSYAPTTNAALTMFDTTQITGGDLDNQGFGSLGDNYGCVVSGWLTPKVSGSYYFFLASDDASELQLSTDSTVNGVATIATESGCCHGFLEPDSASNAGQTTPTPIALTANTPYFIRAFMTEGGGGDYVKVAWRLSTDSTPATNLTAIPSQYLSSYVILPPPTFQPLTRSGANLTIAWTGPATLVQSTNVAAPLSNWVPVAITSPYTVNTSTAGPRHFYRLIQ